LKGLGAVFIHSPDISLAASPPAGPLPGHGKHTICIMQRIDDASQGDRFIIFLKYCPNRRYPLPRDGFGRKEKMDE